jgi:hypothetical protein
MANEKIISLVPKPGVEPDPDVIELLEDVMSRARRGEILAVAVATAGVTASSAWAGIEGQDRLAAQLGGAVMALNARYATMLADVD